MGERIFSNDEIRTIYDRLGSQYNRSLLFFRLMGFRVKAYRKAAIEKLQLQPGNTVVDLGCGTGLNFEYLQEQVGDKGQIIGVDLSGGMLEKAKQKIESEGWHNITLVQADIADYQFPEETNGILSTMALTMSPRYDEIIHHAAEALKKEGAFVIFEFKEPFWSPPWLTRLMIRVLHSYGTRFEHTKRKPWQSLEKYFKSTETEDRYFGMAYIAKGTNAHV